MTLRKVYKVTSMAALAAVSVTVLAVEPQQADENVLQKQREELAEATADKGYGPQSPRDIDILDGENDRVFEAAPPYTEMNLCNIHFHENAEHKGGEFAKFAGYGDGKGHGTGYVYGGELSEAELAPIDREIGKSLYNDLRPGETIEIHYVHTTAKIDPGPSLGSCMNEAIANPQLRVEAQVYVLVNDESAADFMELTALGDVDGLHQALNIPADTGTPVEYAGSTTGPGYNEKGSPYQVTWSVRPQIKKVNIETVETWLQANVFEEDHAHGVRNLVVNPKLLSAGD